MPNIKSFSIAITFFVAFCCISFSAFSKGYISKPYFYESIIFLGLIFYKPAYAVANSIFISVFLGSSVILFYYFCLPVFVLIDILYFQLALILFIITGLFFLFINTRFAFKSSFLGLIVIFISFQFAYFLDKKILEDRFSTSIVFNKIEFSVSKEVVSAKSQEFRILQSDKSERLVIIVWEALGVPYDKSVFNSFNQKFPLVEIKEMETKPRSTLESEFNILCNSKITQNLESLECLPKKYQYPKAYHGNNKSYFSRGSTYPKMGFKEFEARSDFPNAPTCTYAYTAVCDAFIFKIVKEEIKNKRHDFLYFLTIDSHFPFNKYTDYQREIFHDLELVIKFFVELKEGCDCSIYIMGDHPPVLAPQFENNKTLFIKI